MRLRAGVLTLVTILTYTSLAATNTIVMPTEIGVSCHKHKPFTATAHTTLSRVYPSGLKKTVTTEDRIARNRDGAVLREQHAPWTEDATQPVYYINIVDPGKMERIHIDPQKHLVVDRPVDQHTQWDYVPYDGTQYRIATKPGVTVDTKSLGNQEIGGLKCRGERTTYLYSPGTLHGNQGPLTRTLEVWYAKELGADIRITAHDPNPEAGDQQTDLIDIKYGEPDSTIFVPPTGYSVQSAEP
jgi:hypothetical protein